MALHPQACAFRFLSQQKGGFGLGYGLEDGYEPESGFFLVLLVDFFPLLFFPLRCHLQQTLLAAHPFATNRLFPLSSLSLALSLILSSILFADSPRLIPIPL